MSVTSSDPPPVGKLKPPLLGVCPVLVDSSTETWNPRDLSRSASFFAAERYPDALRALSAEDQLTLATVTEVSYESDDSRARATVSRTFACRVESPRSIFHALSLASDCSRAFALAASASRRLAAFSSASRLCSRASICSPFPPRHKSDSQKLLGQSPLSDAADWRT